MNADHILLHRRITSFYPPRVVATPCAAHRQVACHSSRFHFAASHDFFFKWNAVIAKRIGIVNDNHLVFVKSQLFVLNIIELTIDRQRADHEENGNGKLEYHEGASDKTALHSQGNMAL